VSRFALPASLLILTLAACGHTTTPTPAAPATTTTTTTAVSAEPATKTSSPSAAPTEQPLTGTQYAFLKSADLTKKTLTFDLVEWFEGDKATAACKADGEPIGDSEWCTGYYYRNKNKKLRTLPLKPGAKLTAVDMSSGPVKQVVVTLPKFKTSLAASGHLFKFDVADGVITTADEVYTP
jgi:hypothetical protein